MKKLICLMLILALAAPMLTACHRRAAEETPAATDAPEGGQGGPGYTITDGDRPSVPDPLATLTPQQRAAMLAENESEAGELADDLVPAAEMTFEETVDEVPDAYDEDGDAPLDTYDEGAEEARADAAPAAVNAASVQFSAVMDESVDFTFNYPSDWENVPGIYTVCYRQKVEKGVFPARVAVTRKKLVHTPDETVMIEQLTGYLKSIAKQYEPSTFQIGVPTSNVTLIRRKALANTYLAYWGNVEVKGYVIGVSVDRTLYVFHFCASYADYAAMESVMQYMVNSVALRQDPRDKKKR